MWCKNATHMRQTICFVAPRARHQLHKVQLHRCLPGMALIHDLLLGPIHRYILVVAHGSEASSPRETSRIGRHACGAEVCACTAVQLHAVPDIADLDARHACMCSHSGSLMPRKGEDAMLQCSTGPLGAWHWQTSPSKQKPAGVASKRNYKSYIGSILSRSASQV
jgi:hypothetical protein